MERVETLVIGAGLAGLSTALHNSRETVVLERARHPGGLAVTHHEDGYSFDVTGHWLHMREAAIKARFSPLLAMHEVERKSKIFTHDRLIAYPFQSNLKDLPHEIRLQCIMGAVEAHCRRRSGGREPERFGDFVEHHFGSGIAREFMVPYNSKLWGVEPNEISRDWCQRFVPIPDLQQILEGCFSQANESAGYNASFSYPNQGGIGTFSAALAAQVPNIRTECDVAGIHCGEKWLETSTGSRHGFDHLVSTIPLKELVLRLVDAPAEVLAAGQRLACTSLRYFNIGLTRPALQGLHWIYLPDSKLPAYRIGSFSNAVPYMAPEGCSSLYVELATDREIDDEAALDSVLDVLSRIGPAVGRADVAVWQTRTVDYAYVIYNHDYQAARNCILDFLAGYGIQSIGRYGKWVYASMEDALIDGRNAAEAIANG